jgi:TonB-dependent starch-binding outer membrane protein SusC
MKVKACLLILFSLALFRVFAGDHLPHNRIPPPKTITGKVTDAKGLPVEGVNIMVKGKKNGATSKKDGGYSIVADDDETLIFTIVGFKTQEIPVRGQANIDVVMQPSDKSMDEVTVISYGTQRKADITGSIATVKASDVADQPVGQFAQKLQGQVAGADVNVNTGKPGQGIEIQIRGAVSINAGNYPLIVVDGQPLAAFDNGNPLNSINPDEIESFTVLKDASATALYGSRAASGVILITTKTAKQGKTHVDVSGYYAEASLDRSHIPKMMDGTQFATFMNQYYTDKIANEGWTNPATGTPTVPSVYANPSQYGKGTNWLNQVLRTAPTQNYTITVSDAREKGSTSITGSYFNQQGIVKNTGYQRYNIRANNEFRPAPGLRLGFNLAPSVVIDHNARGSATDAQRNIIEGALLSSPIVKPYNADGSLSDTASSYGLLAEPNFEQIALNTNDVYTTDRVLGNAYLEWEIIRGLTFRTAADLDWLDQTENRFVNEYAAAGFNAPPPQPLSSVYGLYATDRYLSWVNENTLTFKRTFGDHKLEALAGYTAQKYSENSGSTQGTNYADQSIPYVSAAGTTSGTSSYTQWSLLSTIGRINYSYQDKYLLSAALRSDGSSKFGANKQYGTFPSVSVGWVVTQESFIQQLNIGALNFLKIRASDGLTGNNNFNSGNYPAIALVSPINYVLNGGLTGGRYVSQLGNADLTWEKNRQFDLGVDVGLFNDRIRFTYDYYNKITDGLLYQIDIPQSSGFSSVASNIGTFKFWGHEFTVSSRNLIGEFKWNTNLNVTFNRNVIQKLGTQNLPILPAEQYDYPNIQMVGHPIGMFYGYVDNGVYENQQQYNADPKPSASSGFTSAVGSVRMKDVNGDGVITPDDRTFIGNPNPTFIFGITNNFSYKRFDLTIVLSGSVGNDIEDERAQSAANLDGAFNLYANQLHHWRSPSDIGNGLVPSTLVNTTALYRTVQSLWVHNGSYLAARNITIGYNIRIPKNVVLNRLRAYVSVQQAFVITKYPGFSPETNNQSNAIGTNGLNFGVDNTEYPIPRTISAGLNIGLF